MKWLAVGLLGAELLYVVAVNLFLNFGFFLMFEGTNSVNVTLGRALTFWPGTAYVRDVHLVFQDKNLQFTLDIESATLDVNLHELVSRRFHATSVKGEGAAFRMRHRVEPWSVKEPSMAALTQIPEFPGPAVFEAWVPEPPLTDDTYNLWTVHLEHVDVGMKEAWVQHFRYVGGGRAKGAFRLEPARKLWVGPASLDLDGGPLTAGKYVISPKLSGHIDCLVDSFDVMKPVGTEVFRFISASVDMRAPELSLGVTRLFLPEGPELAAAGGELTLKGRTDHGVLVPGSVLRLTQEQLNVRERAFVGKAPHAELVAQVLPNRRGEAAVTVTGATLVLEGSNGRGIDVAVFSAAAESSSVDTTQPWSVSGAELRELRAKVGDMRSFDGYLARAGWSSSGGATELTGHASYRGGTLAGKLNAVFDGVRLRSGDTALEFDGKASVESDRALLEERSGAATARLSEGRVRVAQGGSVFRAGGLEIQARAEAERGHGSASVKVALANAGMHSGSVRLTATGTFDGKLEEWNLASGAGVGAVRGELWNVRLSAPEAELDVRAKRASIVSSQSQVAGAAGDVSRVAVDATLSELTFTQGDVLRGRAHEFSVNSKLLSRADGALDASLRSRARGVEADYDRMRFRGDTEFNADAKAVDRRKNTGEVRADLSVRDFAASDVDGDADCPWSSVARATVHGLAQMRGAESTHFDVNAVLDSARLAWGDFSSSLAKARVRTNFDARALDEQKGQVVVALDVENAKFKSGTKPTTGWEAAVPKLDFDATLLRQKGVLGGPMQVRANAVETRIGKTPFRADLSGDIGFAQLDLDKHHATGAGTLRVRGLNLAVPGRNIEDWWADVELPFVDVRAKENLDGTATFRANMRDALPALGVLAAEDELPGWVPSIFPLRGLTAEGSVRRGCRLTEFKLSEVTGGPFVAVGRMQSVSDAVRGAFLVRLAVAHPISAGIRFDGDESGVSMFAGSGWLKDRYEPLDRLGRAAESEACEPTPRECGN